MPEFDKLPLEDSLEDGPQTRSILGVFEQDTVLLQKYAKKLQMACQRIQYTHQELTAATRNLAKHLKAYKAYKFPLEDGNESILSSTLQQFATTVDEVSSWHHILATQLADGVIFPLTRFLDTELQELTTMEELHKVATADVDKAYIRYSKLRKKDTESDLKDAAEEVYTSRKKYHQMALHYYAKLNLIQHSRKTGLIEPVLGYVHAMRSFYGLGHESLSTADMDSFISNISNSLQTVHREQVKETQDTVELIDSMIAQSQISYHPEPPPGAPEIPPQMHLTAKTGYLFWKLKYMAVMSSWERSFFFTQGGNLMQVNRGELAGSLVLEIDQNTRAIPMEGEDRRYVFQVISSKKSIILQAMNTKEREEWILTIQNIVRDGGYVKDVPKEASFFSGMGQYLADKIQAASDVMTVPKPTDSDSKRSSLSQSGAASPTPPLSPDLTSLSFTPIVFDLQSSTDAGQLEKEVKEGPPNEENDERINPFDESSAALTVENLKKKSGFSQVYQVRFLGSMEVKSDRGNQLIAEVMRQIMAARAVHNIFKMSEWYLLITDTSVMVVDPGSQAIQVYHELKDVSYWSIHSENNRLFGFITRQQTAVNQESFTCHVFESSTSAEDIIKSLDTAAKIGYTQIMEKKLSTATHLDEKELLLENVRLQEEKNDEKLLSADGQFLVLDNPPDPSPSKDTDTRSIETDTVSRDSGQKKESDA